MRRTPPPESEILRLYHVEGLGAAAIGEHFGYSAESIRIRLRVLVDGPLRRVSPARKRHPKIAVGSQFGRWTVVAPAERDEYSNARWRCICECGVVKLVQAGRLTGGASLSCGCASVEALVKRATKHGHCYQNKGRRSPEYACWAQMINKCRSPKHQDWKLYGGRGIAVCERWQRSFVAFLADMGPRPSPRHSINRRDNDGNYEPNNCHWATPLEQGRNKRGTRMVTAFGVTLCVSEWAERTGRSYDVLLRRLSRGVPPEEALTVRDFRTVKRREHVHPS